MSQMGGGNPGMGNVNMSPQSMPMQQVPPIGAPGLPGGGMGVGMAGPPGGMGGPPGGMPPHMVAQQPHPPMMQQVPPAQQPPPQGGPNAAEMQHKFDNVAKVRDLVGNLKDSLSNVIRVAATNLYHSAAVDNGLRSNTDGNPPRLDKALEDLFSICNQIEFNLVTIQECVMQYRDSQQYLPIPVHPAKPDTGSQSQDGPLSYGQYISTIGAQVAFAKQVQEILKESATRLQQAPQMFQ